MVDEATAKEAVVHKMMLSLVTGLLIGVLLGYALLPKFDDQKMKEKEAQIDTLTKQLSIAQSSAKESLAKLQAIEEQKKAIDQKIKGDFDELQQANRDIHGALDRLKAQVRILHKALCDYSNDFCS